MAAPEYEKRNSINLLVTETFDAGLLGEHVLETLDHAFKSFLSQNCTIIPCRASVYIMPINCEAVRRKTRISQTNAGILSYEGVKIISKELDEEPYTSERLNTLPGGFKCLSSDFGEKLIDINFENANQINEYLFDGRTFERTLSLAVPSAVVMNCTWFEKMYIFTCLTCDQQCGSFQ